MADDDKEEVRLGDYVELSAHRLGMVKYVGEIHGKKGVFYGVELWKGDGKHSGTYEGVEYFECYNVGMGVFVIPKAILYILDVPPEYEPFKQLRLKRAAQAKKKQQRNAKYSNLDNKNKKNKKNKKSNNNKSRYKSNNKQSKKATPKNKKPLKNNSQNRQQITPKAKSLPKPLKNNRQQSTQSKYVQPDKKNTKKNQNTFGRDKSDTIMSANEFKSISLAHLLGKGDNFDIAKRICKFYDDLFSDTDTVCLVANIGLKPSFALSVEGDYQRTQTFDREGKYVLVYRSNPHTDAVCLVAKQCFKSVVKGLSMDYDINGVLMNLDKLFGFGCHVVRSKKISFDIYSRFSDGYECEIRLPNGGDYVLSWRR